MNNISQHISRKRYNKANTNVIYYMNDKNIGYSGSVKHIRNSWKLGTAGTSTGRRPRRSPRTPGSSGWTSPRRQELSSSRVSQKNKRKRVEEASVSTQLVLNKYNTNYEALRLADLTALAFNLGKILLKLLLQVDELPCPSYIVINQN